MSINNSRQSIRSIRKGILRNRRTGTVSITILMGIIVALSAYFALAQSGYSIENERVCGVEEHIHDESCFFKPELICDLEETEGHTHSNECFSDEFGQICTQVETVAHKHGEECYYIEKELICDKEATSDGSHKHNEQCYRPALICGLEEHMHSSECYANNKNNTSSGAVRLMSFALNNNDNDSTDPPASNEEAPVSEETESAEPAEPEETESAAPEETEPVEPTEPIEQTEPTESAEPSENDTEPTTEPTDTGSSSGSGNNNSYNPPSVSTGGSSSSSGKKVTNNSSTTTTVVPNKVTTNSGVSTKSEIKTSTSSKPAASSSGTSEIKPFGGAGEQVLQRGRQNGTSQVATITSLIIKKVRGEGARRAIDNMDDDDVLFRIVAEELENKDDVPTGEKEDEVASIIIRKGDFELDPAKINKSGVFGIAEVYISIPIYDYGPQYYIIYEKDMTKEDPKVPGAEKWIYDKDAHVIEVDFSESTGAATITSLRSLKDPTKEDIVIRVASTTSLYLQASDDLIIPEIYYGLSDDSNKEIYVNKIEQFYYPSDERCYEYFLDHIEKAIDAIDNEYVALCADWTLDGPNRGSSYANWYDGNNDRTSKESALAMAFLNEGYGAMLSDADFIKFFGFSDEEGEIVRKGSYANTLPGKRNDLRKLLIQYAVWFYELKELQDDDSDTMLRYRNKVNANASWNIWGDECYLNWPYYHPNSSTPNAIRDYDPDKPLMRRLIDIYTEISLSNVNTGDYDGVKLFDAFLKVLRKIEEMMKYYRMNNGSESITSISLEYDRSKNKINIIYEGYNEPVHEVKLTWTGSVELIITRGGKPVEMEEDEDCYWVMPGDDIRVLNSSDDVTFTIDDPMCYLAKGSILGTMLDKVPKGNYQRLIIGTAKFAKLKATLTLGSHKFVFVNYYTMMELPSTVGLGIDKFIIAGTMLMLVSATVLFTKGVRPIKQGIHDESRARLLSLIGKRRTRKRWYSIRQRE